MNVEADTRNHLRVYKTDIIHTHTWNITLHDTVDVDINIELYDIHT